MKEEESNFLLFPKLHRQGEKISLKHNISEI